jgi:hypothetical protein
MPWSRIVAMLRDRLTPELRGRVKVHQARYRHAHGELGRIWLALDGQEIASFTPESYGRGQRFIVELLDADGGRRSAEQYLQAEEDAAAIMERAGDRSDYDAQNDLETYLSMPVAEALRSPNPLFRALAVVDRRVGKRTLRSLTIGPREHQLVRTLFEARCRAEQGEAPASDV